MALDSNFDFFELLHEFESRVGKESLDDLFLMLLVLFESSTT
jgi:hypothetical protein